MRREFAISDRCIGPMRRPRCSRVQRSLGIAARPVAIGWFKRSAPRLPEPSPAANPNSLYAVSSA